MTANCSIAAALDAPEHAKYQISAIAEHRFHDVKKPVSPSQDKLLKVGGNTAQMAMPFGSVQLVLVKNRMLIRPARTSPVV